jgi:hypothetical protein
MHAITTLEHLIADGYSITAHCGDCQHSRPIDLAGLAERLGAGFVAIGTPNPLMAILRCEECGSKAVGLIIGAPGVSTPGLGLYGKM